MIYLDTHVVVWLYAGLIEKLSTHAIDLIENNSLIISPIVKLELCYLHETKRVTRTSQVIIHELETKLGIKTCDLTFDSIAHKAATLSWTRDPFDRLICANAIANQSKLLTKDKMIRKHLKLATWD